MVTVLFTNAFSLYSYSKHRTLAMFSNGDTLIGSQIFAAN